MEVKIDMNKSEFTNKVLQAEPTLYHIAKSIVKNDHDCCDAVQEAILKAFVKLGQLRDERFFKTWLCRILINECYKIVKSSKFQVTLEENTATYENQNIGLYDAIMKLNEKHRLAVTLHYIDGFSVAETAKILRVPQGTVKSRLNKARVTLKLELMEEEQYNEKCIPQNT